jgi:hypothetical protein
LHKKYSTASVTFPDWNIFVFEVKLLTQNLAQPKLLVGNFWPKKLKKKLKNKYSIKIFPNRPFDVGFKVFGFETNLEK